MTDLFINMGSATSTMGGLVPITWSEIESYSRLCNLNLSAWEADLLMSMSRAYCSWNAKGGQQKDIAEDVPYIDRSVSATDYLIRQREASAKNAQDAKSGKLDA